ASNQCGHHVEITIGRAVAELSEAILSPAIGGARRGEGTGGAAVILDTGADRCEREPPRYADGRSATWQVSDVKEETPREEDGNDWGTEGAVVVVAPTEGCPGGREPAGVVAAAAHGGKPRLSNGDRRGPALAYARRRNRDRAASRHSSNQPGHRHGGHN